MVILGHKNEHGQSEAALNDLSVKDVNQPE
jgi:hypothetical protein